MSSGIIKLSTPLGEMDLCLHSQTRCAVQFPRVVINGVAYSGSLRLADYEGKGTFIPARDDGSTNDYYSLSLHREGGFTEATTAARRKLKTLLPPLVSQWAAAHGRLLLSAEIQKVTGELGRLGDKIDELREDLDEQLAEQQKQEQYLATLRQQVGVGE